MGGISEQQLADLATEAGHIADHFCCEICRDNAVARVKSGLIKRFTVRAADHAGYVCHWLEFTLAADGLRWRDSDGKHGIHRPEHPRLPLRVAQFAARIQREGLHRGISYEFLDEIQAHEKVYADARRDLDLDPPTHLPARVGRTEVEVLAKAIVKRRSWRTLRRRIGIPLHHLARLEFLLRWSFCTGAALTLLLFSLNWAKLAQPLVLFVGIAGGVWLLIFAAATRDAVLDNPDTHPGRHAFAEPDKILEEYGEAVANQLVALRGARITLMLVASIVVIATFWLVTERLLDLPRPLTQSLSALAIGTLATILCCVPILYLESTRRIRGVAAIMATIIAVFVSFVGAEALVSSGRDIATIGTSLMTWVAASVLALTYLRLLFETVSDRRSTLEIVGFLLGGEAGSCEVTRRLADHLDVIVRLSTRVSHKAIFLQRCIHAGRWCCCFYEMALAAIGLESQ